MKMLEWQKFLIEQKEAHGKVLFSVAELANAANTNLHSLNTQLGRLIKRGIMARYAKGFYGTTKGAQPEQLIPLIDRTAYITGFSTLFHHHLVTQVPFQVTCFSNRRHNRKLQGSLGPWRLKFITVTHPIYSMPKESVFASREQALCDFVWLCLRERVRPENLVTFRNLDRLNMLKLRTQLKRYPEKVREIISSLTKIKAMAA